MLGLALDTSNNSCSACVIDGASHNILSSVSEEIGKGHAERLMHIIDDALQSAGTDFKNLNRIITSTGPGSFTGARVCVAAARGLALTLRTPAIGVSNFDAFFGFAERSGVENLAVLMNAGRGQMFGQFNFDSEFSKAGIPFIVDIDALKSSSVLKGGNIRLSGNNVPEIQKLLKVHLPELDLGEFSLIEELAFVGIDKVDDGVRPEPLYLRAADAKPQQGFAIERVNG